MKIKITFTIITIVVIITILTVSSSAISGFTASVGTTYDGVDTSWSAEFSSQCYKRYGYSQCNFLMDPNYILRISNMGAKVQYYNEHGNVNLVRGLNSGIAVGKGNDSFYVGTDKFDTWEQAGTILVTYNACLTAGDGGVDENSITYRTVVRGAKIAIGWTEKIQSDSATLWANNFNHALSNGYGVYDAAEFATSFGYDDERVKSWQIFYIGNPNLNLEGNQGIVPTSSKAEIISDVSISIHSRNLVDRINLKDIKNKYSYNDIISMFNSDFNSNNYEVVKTKAGCVNVETGERIEKEYVSLKLKIGDFITNAGYVVAIENNDIVAIYDNNIDISKQKAYINDNNFKENSINNFNEENYINKAIEQVSEKFVGYDVNITKTGTKYYYDIESNKKYFVVSVSVELNEDNMLSISEDAVYFEIG